MMTRSAPAPTSASGVGAGGRQRMHRRADLPSQPDGRRPSSSPATWGRPGSASTATTRPARRCGQPCLRLGGDGGAAPARGRAGVGVPVERPRRASSWTARRTCFVGGPVEDEELPRVLHGRVAPTTVGLAASPHGPAPRSPAAHAPQASGVDGRPPVWVPPCRGRRGARRRSGRRAAPPRPPGSRRRARARGGVTGRVLELPDAAGEGEAEQLRQFGSDLPGLAVDGVAAEQDEVEGSRGRTRAAARARAVASVSEPANAASQQVEAAVRPPGDALAQHVLGAGGPERDHRARAAGRRGRA